MKNQRYIAVRSLTTLKAIYDQKLLGTMVRVTFETSEDENTYPVFIFPESEVVRACIEKFGADDRSMDDPALWSGFDAQAVKDHDTGMKLNTRNYQVVARAFGSGQMGNLVECRYDNTRKVFKFVHTEVLEKIKDEEDAKSKAIWEAKQKREGGNNENK